MLHKDECETRKNRRERHECIREILKLDSMALQSQSRKLCILSKTNIERGSSEMEKPGTGLHIDAVDKPLNVSCWSRAEKLLNRIVGGTIKCIGKTGGFFRCHIGGCVTEPNVPDQGIYIPSVVRRLDKRHHNVSLFGLA